MDEISNKTLATLLVVAIVISLAGTFFAMRGVNQVTNYISGFQNAETGTAAVNISELAQILLVNTTVDFGTGSRNVSAVSPTTTCNLTSRREQTPVDNCWEYTAGEFDTVNPFLLRNDGNVYVAVTINSSIADTFISGAASSDKWYMWTASENVSGSYPNWVSTTGPGDASAAPEDGCEVALDGIGTWTSFSNSPQSLCTNMSPYAAEDEFVIDIKVGIPAGPTGVKTTDVVFEAVKSTQ